MSEHHSVTHPERLRTRLFWQVVDVVLPLSLLLLLFYLLWPSLGAPGLTAAIVATLVSTLLATLARRRQPATVSARQSTGRSEGKPAGVSDPADASCASGTAHALLADSRDMLARGEKVLDSRTPRMLAVIELGWLAEVNLRLGREAGDTALHEMASLIETALSEGELVARLRGDQFAVLMDSESAGAGFRRLRAIQARHARQMASLLNVPVRSVAGVAWYPRHGHDMATLLRHACTALDIARSTERECVIYSPGIETGPELEHALTSDLSRSLDEGNVLLSYQPLIPVNGRGVCALEVLARWQHPEWGSISPDTFVCLAERGGFINRLTRFVIEEAVANLARWRASGTEARLSINLSACDLFDDTLPAYLSRICADASVPAACVTLEVTETAMISDLSRARLTLKRLRRLGHQVVIDDFGTGYSSLSHLRQLPVDGIKIDKSFVRRMARGNGESAIVRLSIELAHSLGLRVTAEGVENEYIEALVGEFGCDMIQGFSVCPPLRAEDVPAWLDSGNGPRASTRAFQQHLPLTQISG